MNRRIHGSNIPQILFLALVVIVCLAGVHTQAQTLSVSAAGPTTISFVVGNTYNWEIQQKNGSKWTRVITGSTVRSSATYTLERPAGTYTFRLYNCFPKTDGCSTSSSWSVILVGNTPPAAPSVSASVSQAAINISWSAPAGARSYTLSRPGRGNVTQSTRTFTDTAVTPGTTYTYSVVACNAAAQCSSTGTKTIMYPPVPAAPGVSAVVQGPAVRATWTPVSGLKYELVRGSLIVKPASTPYLDSAVTAGSSYTYVLKACNEAGVCSAGSSATVTVPVIPPVPTVSANFLGATVAMTWASSGAHSFEMKRDGVVKASGSATAYMDEAVVPGTTHTYTVKACNVNNQCSALVTKSAPIPTGPMFQVDVTGPNSFTIRVGNVYSWNVQESKGGAWPIFTTGATGNYQKLDFTKPGGTYTFRLSNCYPTTGGCSTSASKTIILTGNPPPSPPTGATAVMEGPSVKVSWSHPGAASYKWERIGSGTIHTPVQSPFIDNTVIPGTTYTYKVYACNATGECSFATTKIDVPPPPPVPTVSADFMGATVQVNWSSSGAHSFEMKRDGVVKASGSATSYLDESPVAGSSHTYSVKACDVYNQCSAVASTAPVTIPTGPLFQLNVTGLNSFTVRVGNVYSWSVQEAVGSGWQTLPPGNAGDHKLDVTRPGGTYKLRLYNCYPITDGCSTSSSKTITLVGNPPPAAPTVTANMAGTSVFVDWTMPAGTVFYKLKRLGLSLELTTSEYLDSGVAPGTSYIYTVSACNATGECSRGTAPITVPALPTSNSSSNVLSSSSVNNSSSTSSTRSSSSSAYTEPALIDGTVIDPPPTGEPASTIGVIAGQFRVSESGASNYSVPLSLPVGTAGVQPQLSFDYSSQTGIGVLGQGWNLSGLSSITRCRQTLIHDQYVKPITWSKDDRFCLDGQRLMLSSGAYYGQSGSEYKLEIDGLSLITAVGGSDGHPAYFKVEAKDGSVSFYGYTADSQFTGAAANTTLTWAINRFQDNVGNGIDFVYQGDAAIGHQIYEVRYAFPTPNGSGPSGARSDHQASARFNYSTREDTKRAYVAGHSFSQTQLLKSVDIYNGDESGNTNLYRHYKLSYMDPITVDQRYENNISRLEHIHECVSSTANSSECIEPLTFLWGGGSHIAYTQQSSSFSFLNAAAGRYLLNNLFADVTGDGKLDVIYLMYETPVSQQLANLSVYISYTNRTGITDTSRINLNGVDYKKIKIANLDYNADGRQDLALYDGTTWKIYLAKIDGNNLWRISSANSVSGLPTLDQNTMFVDVNSDGLADAVTPTGVRLLKRNNNPISSTTAYSFGAAQSFSWSAVTNFPLVQQLPPAQSYSNCTFDRSDLKVQTHAPADFNGDGAADYLGLYTKNFLCNVSGYSPKVNVVMSYQFALVNQNGALTIYGDEALHSSSGSASADERSRSAVDINGDGLTDIVNEGANNSYTVKINTGAGFGAAQDWATLTGLVKDRSPQYLDYNGDGATDILWHDRTASALKVAYWEDAAEDLSDPISIRTVTGMENDAHFIMDITGDGIFDYINITSSEIRGVRGSMSVKNPAPICHTISTPSGMKENCTDPSFALDSTQQHNFIYQVNNGLGNVIQIFYGTLSNSGHYRSMDVNPELELVNDCPVGAPCTPGPSYYTADASAFYGRLNGQWELPAGHLLLNAATGTMEQPDATESKNDPVLEINGAIQVVTAVKSSAPLPSLPSAMSEVRYYYGEAKMQAMGRGFLGFNSLMTLDMQSNISTVTRYRQDFPFIGRPLTTTIFKGGRSGAMLSHAINQWDTKVLGGSGARRYQPYLKLSTEKSFLMDSAGAVSSEPLQTVTTDTTLYADEYSNPHIITTTTAGGGTMLTKTVTNEYYLEDWALRMGRLKSSSVETTLDGQSVTRTAQFKYYGVDGGGTAGGAKGLLKEETVSASNAETLVTEYLYDTWGNKRRVKATGLAEPGREETRTVTHTYDPSGRHLLLSNNDLDHAKTFGSYNKFGSPQQAVDINGMTTEVSYDKFGQEYLRVEKLPSGSTGAWTRTDNSYCNGDCPAGARYYKHTRVSGGGESREYFDVLGRTVRSAKIGFDGQWINVDTEYDNLSRVKRQSLPYFNGSLPAGWMSTEYDDLGRVESVTNPGEDGDIINTSTVAANIFGMETTTTNPLGQVRKEVHNGLGQLVYVEDQLGGSLTYEHSPLGELLSVTTSAPDADDVVVRMCYDDLGRKIGMFDPDKGGFKGNATASCGTVAAWQGGSSGAVSGWWHYRYNAFGELVEQRDPKGQSSHLAYDQLGRMINRKDYLPSSVIEAQTAWFYDKALGASVVPKTKGQLTAVIMSQSAAPIAFSETSCSGTNHCVAYNYDERSQPDMVFTRLPDGQEFYTETKYDTLGRAYEQSDVIGGTVFPESGVQTHYNTHGYAYRTMDIAPLDGSKGVLSTILEMNERGQVVRESRGNGLTSVNTYNPNTGFLEHQEVKDALGLRNIQANTYTWDSVGNLISRHNNGAHISLDPNSITQKNRQEGFCYDALNRLIATLPTVNPGCGGTPDVTYDGLGNIKSKAGVGTYQYNRVDGGPHAVTQAGNARYAYDNNGNMITETQSGSALGNRTFTYTSYDLVKSISRGGNSVEFKYGPDRTRWQRIDRKGQVTTTTTYLGNVERIQTGTGPIEWKRQVAGVVHTYKTSTTPDGTGLLTPQLVQKDFLYLDHLGSVDVITNAVGKVTHSMGFDAWGARRDGEADNPTAWNALTEAQRHTFIGNSLTLANFAQPITTRGYTSHEMVDGMDIIHMNGRIYDPRLGRFLQADPHVDGATNTQGYNRYSYVHNNPLNAIDPSGFFLKKLWNKIRPFVGAIVAVVAGYFLCANTCTPELYAAIGAFSGAAGAAANGGNIVQGAVFGAFSGAAGGAGGFLGFAARGAVGGLQSRVNGAKFGHGFWAAGIGGLGGGQGYSVVGFLQAAVLGGAATEISGGKFKNGAATAAFMWALSAGVQKVASLQDDTGSSDVLDGAVGEGLSLYDGKISVHAAGDGTVVTDDQLSTVKSGLKSIFENGGEEGSRLYSALDSDNPLKIIVNNQGANAAYLKGRILSIDLSSKVTFIDQNTRKPFVASTTRILGHEMGHALLGLHDIHPFMPWIEIGNVQHQNSPIVRFTDRMMQNINGESATRRRYY